MYIYLDESKSFNKNQKKIVFGGFVTNLKPVKIDKLHEEFLENVGIKNFGGEIKSSNKKYEKDILGFYKFLKNKNEFKDIEFVGAYCEKYEESGENFYFILVGMLKWILLKNKFKLKKVKDIKIISDNLKLSLNKKEIIGGLKSDIRLVKIFKKISMQKLEFNFADSKRYGGIKFADFIAGLLRKKYISKTDNLDLEFKECFIGKSYAIFVNIE